MTGRLEGRNIAITGTASGQGRAAALLFTREGARVFGCDRNEAGSRETVDAVAASGGDMVSQHPVDLSVEGEAENWLESVIDQCGRLNVLYNNASLPRFAPVAHMERGPWEFTLANELTLVMSACRAVWPHFVEGDAGVILNTASTAGMVAFPELGNVAHAAAKGGVIAMTRQLAAEGAPHGIRANCISPGFIATAGTQRLQQNVPVMEHMLARHMLDRPGTPEDVAACALYLVSDEAAWVTGANFAIDGGLTAW